jgi:hypothetical protein
MKTRFMMLTVGALAGLGSLNAQAGSNYVYKISIPGLQGAAQNTPATILAEGGTRTWSDGTYAASCYGYIAPTGNRSYSGATGNGIYRIQPSAGAVQDVYCDMTSDSGGWTLVMRGLGGNNSSGSTWGTAAALNAAQAYAANAPTGNTFKLADVTINQIRAGGPGMYRTQADGTYSVKRFWASGTYAHTTKPPVSSQETTSYATLSLTGAISATSGYLAAANYGGGLTDDNLYGSVYFDTMQPDTGWVVGTYTTSTCLGGSVNCNFTMWVR